MCVDNLGQTLFTSKNTNNMNLGNSPLSTNQCVRMQQQNGRISGAYPMRNIGHAMELPDATVNARAFLVSYLFQNSNDSHDSFSTGNNGIHNKGNVRITFTWQSIEILNRSSSRHMIHTNMVDSSLWEQLQYSIRHSQTTSQNRNQSDLVSNLVSHAVIVLVHRFLSNRNRNRNFAGLEKCCRLIAQMIGDFFEYTSKLTNLGGGRTKYRNLTKVEQEKCEM